MSRRNMYRAFLLAFSLLATASLAGCRSEENLPFYLLEKHEDYSESLYIDGAQYQRKNGSWDEHAHYFHDGDQYTWTPAEGIREQIGVCGIDADKEASLNIYEVAGDEDHIFLYTWPAHFYFGGTEGRLWMQDSVTMGPPTTETVSSITIAFEEQGDAPAQVSDPTMIASLLEAYNGDSVQVPNGEGWVYGSLIMHHKEYPFLQYEVECRYSLDQEIAYCSRSKSGEWFVLSAEWFAVISEHDFLNRDE